jgi:hypothetical protein
LTISGGNFYYNLGSSLVRRSQEFYHA